MVGTPGVRVVDVVVVVGCSTVFDSCVRSAVFEVRSSISRDNRIRSDTPLRVDLEVLMLGPVVLSELRVQLNRELELDLDPVLELE